MKNINILICVFGLFFLSSCNKKNKGASVVRNAPVDIIDTSLKAKNNIIIPTSSLPYSADIEADLDIQSPNFSQAVSAKFKFKKADTTWISITGIFGIEGARILITRDTFHVLDRINRKYIKGPIALSKKLLPIQLDLNSFQYLLLGLASYAIDSSFFASAQQDTLMYEKNQQNFWRKSEWFKNSLIGFTDKDLTSGYRINAKLYDHRSNTIPYKRQYTISNNQQEYLVDFKITSCELNKPMDFKFDISQKYEKVLISN